MNDLDFLNQEPTNKAIEPNIVEPSNAIEPQQTSSENELFSAPSWEDIKTGKLNYEELPSEIKSKIKNEAFEDTPDDKKWLWEQGYTPPELYKGFDKHGRKVQAYDLDGFEDLLKRKGLRKTKVEQDVENLTNLVKEQNKTILSQRESDLDKRISDAKENVDFETYEKLLSEKQDIKFQKLQLEKKPQSVEPVGNEVDYSQQYSLPEQTAIQVFTTASENKNFIDIMGKSQEMRKDFDEVGFSLAARNPKASLNEILAATKTIIESKYNLNKQQKPMFRNTIQSEQKTNIEQKPTLKLNYSILNDRDKKWVNSEARSGKPKYSGKSLDEITNMVYGHLVKK